jgi:hypothetical protein
MPGTTNNVNQDYIDIVRVAMEMDGTKLPDVIPEEALDASLQGKHALPKLKFKVKYRKFNMALDEDVLQLESMKTAIVNGEYIGAREEWNHTKDGDSYVMLSWLVPLKPPPDPNIPREDPG